MNSPQKEKKLFDIWKHLRRIKYRVTNFFQYRLLASSKHMLLIGSKQHPLCEGIYKDFGRNWRIVHMGYFEPDDPVKENVTINLNERKQQDGSFGLEELTEIEEKIIQFSKHYETILVLGAQVKDQPNIIETGDIESFSVHQKDIRQALIASRLACKILYTNGLLMFTANETSYDPPSADQETNIQQVIKDCQLQHLGLILGERDDLENDTLVMNLLLRDELSEQMKVAILKYIKMWSDGLKRPASGTFVRFKQSEHTKPIIFPDIF